MILYVFHFHAERGSQMSPSKLVHANQTVQSVGVVRPDTNMGSTLVCTPVRKILRYRGFLGAFVSLAVWTDN